MTTVASKPTAQTNRERIQELEVTVHELDRIIVRGNGHPSMQEEMRRMAGDIQDIRKTWNRWTDLVSKAAWLALGLLMTQFCAGIIAATYLMIRLAPIIDSLEKIVRTP
jgi:hypothetical protein